MYSIESNLIKGSVRSYEERSVILELFPNVYSRKVPGDSSTSLSIVHDIDEVKRVYGYSKLINNVSVMYEVTEDKTFVITVLKNNLKKITVKHKDFIITEFRDRVILSSKEPVHYDTSIITTHFNIMSRILDVLSTYVDVEFILPSTSILLMLKLNPINSASIKAFKLVCNRRFGLVEFAVKRY